MAKPAGRRIRDSQTSWAQAHQIVLDKDAYCADIAANLFQPLTACTRRDLEAGDGAELGTNGERGKLQAVHSSSALVCNAFDFWRGRDLEHVGLALGLLERPCSIRFEGQFRTGLRGTPPNLDIVFEGASGTTSAIESKYSEPYAKSKSKSRFKEKYFDGGARLWAQSGLPAAQGLADSLQAGQTAFTYLDAAQLLKHCLGLAHNRKQWNLTYLWYDVGGEEGAAHQAEIDQFTAAVGTDSSRVAALTYQEFFARLARGLPESAAGYRRYLQERYFS